MSAIEHLPGIDNGLLRFLTCGSVDDGKSTLIGRLLYDTRTILADTLHAITRTSERRGLETVDLSLLTDGLQAEREQGITIDVAYRYFSTGRRKYIIADAPGHEQYTRNMVTAASTANLAIILIDARKGVLTQTRRHSYLAHLVGIPHIIVAINKMDLVDYDRTSYERIRSDYLEFAATLGIGDVRFIPLSALNGDMIVDRGERLAWYQGPTLLDILENAPTAHSERDEAFRFPVQFVCRPQKAGDPKLHDYRGFMGRVESGEIAVGDEVLVLPSEQRTRVKAIEIYGTSLPRAIAEQSVTLLLEDEVDVSRGDMIVRAQKSALVTRRIEAMLCWLGEAPLDPQRKYLIRQTTRETRAAVEAIGYRLDINSLQQMPAERLGMNDIARVFFKLAQPLCVDTYADNRSTGAFIVIDETNNNTVGAGMIL
ncbi:sulfate adenylyltransferase subunit CysN [Sulfuritalea hydrogenivorans]|uniref:sulfate adenylyltransferase n=1 Tax=Sulfuritalea hydrogenivorans sk43H TaxID=1223802 RepID=W0SCL2_9PROT|nr:sulfate adenylyltransferase subunit CysN [Sulfuritalea hydrogenivorans]BAO28495.1 sulfate adenylyltransferase large subunit [Sulfuritalea hydrogenivorans sk43H]